MSSKHIDHIDLIDLWQAVPFLQSVSHGTVGELAAVAASHSYLRGEMIFAEGEPTAGLCLVETGTVKICRYSTDGREHILYMAARGDTFNDVSAFDGGPNPAFAFAFTDVRLRCVTRADLQRVAHRHPELAWALLESIARRTRYLVDVAHDLAMRNVRGRLARLLLEQAEAVERGEEPVLLTQEEMASQLGTVREVLGRALRSFVAEEIIALDRQHIVILDRDRLTMEAAV